MEKNELKDYVPVIATLKAEKVNDFEFEKPTSRYSKNKLYTDKFDAEISVKVGNAVKDISLRIDRDYISSVGTYDTPEYVEGYDTPYAPEISSNGLKELKETGIEIDFSDILKEYQELVWKAKDEIKANKAKSKREGKALRREQYPTSWPMDFIVSIDKDPNKRIKVADFELKPVGLKQFVHNDKSFVQVFYKGVIGHITKEDDRYIWRNAVSVDKNENDYRDQINLSGDKVKRAKREGTSLLKFLDAVDEYFAIKKARKTRAQNEETARNEKRNILQDASGLKVEISKESKSKHKWNGRYDGSYTYYTYVISLNGTYFSVGTEQFDTEQYGEKTRRTYSIRNFSKLTLKQFKGIIEILSK